MLLHPARPLRPALGWALAVLGLCSLVPVRLTAGESVAAPQSTSIADVAAGAPIVARGGGVGSGDAGSPRPVALMASLDRPALTESGSGGGWGKRDAYIYYRDHDTTTMSGSTDDYRYARRFQKAGEPLLWVRRDGVEWLIEDPEVLAAVDRLFVPMRELGAKQAELGAQQAELGAQQAELGSHQAELGQQQAALGSQQARLAAQMARLDAQIAALNARGGDVDEAEADRLESQERELQRQMRALDDQERELGRRQGELGSRQGDLGGKQGELGQRQSELGERQSALGRQQQEASERAQRDLAGIVDEAIQAGKATRVK
jgi:hypothetical protein